MIDRASIALPRRLLAVALGLGALYLVLLTGQRALEAYRMNQELTALQGEIEAMRARNLDLQVELSTGRAEEDIERIARDELGLVRPGDRPVVLIWPEGAPPRGQPGRSPGTSEEPNWQRWLRLFVDLQSPAQ